MTTLFSGFGAFPGVPDNATERMMHVLGERGREVVVLPVEWGVAAERLLARASQLEASLVLMSGVAKPSQPLWIEAGATNVSASRLDAAGRLPTQASELTTVAVSLDLERAATAATAAIAELAHVTEAGRRFEEVVRGVLITPPREDNAYVCNDTTFRVARALAGTRTRAGFFHWPSDLTGAHVEAASLVLLAVERAL